MEYHKPNYQRDRYWISQGLSVPLCTTTHRQGKEAAQFVSLDPNCIRFGKSLCTGYLVSCPVQAHVSYLGPSHSWEMLLTARHISCWVHWLW